MMKMLMSTSSGPASGSTTSAEPSKIMSTSASGYSFSANGPSPSSILPSTTKDKPSTYLNSARDVPSASYNSLLGDTNSSSSTSTSAFYQPPIYSSNRSIEAKKNFLVNLEQIDLRSQEKLSLKKEEMPEKHPAEVVEEIGKSLMSVSLIDPKFMERSNKASNPMPVPVLKNEDKNTIIVDKVLIDKEIEDDEDGGDIDDNQPENDDETDEDKQNIGDEDIDYAETFGVNGEANKILLEPLPEPEITLTNGPEQVQLPPDTIEAEKPITQPKLRSAMLLSDSELSQSDVQHDSFSNSNYTDDERSDSDDNVFQHNANPEPAPTFDNILVSRILNLFVTACFIP